MTEGRPDTLPQATATEHAGVDPAGLPAIPAIPADGVLLHVGVHKTGTTALQAALAAARPDLARHGVRYPGRRQAHHGAAVAVLGKTWGWQGQGGQQTDRATFDRLADEVRRHRRRTVVSSEHLCEASPEVGAHVVESLGGSRVHVLVALRPLGELLPSSYQQYLKYGLQERYDAWLENTLATDDRRRLSPTFWRRNDHGAVVARWAEAAGPGNVTVLVLDGLPRSAPFSAVARLLDVPEQVLVSRMGLASNRSMTAAEAELLRRVNVAVRDRMAWGDYARLVRGGLAGSLVEGRTPTPDEPALHTPEWARRAAAERGAGAVARIRQTGVRVVGDLDALAASRPAAAAPTVATSAPADIVPTEAAAHALAALLLSAAGERTAGGPAAVERLRRAGRRARRWAAPVRRLR